MDDSQTPHWSNKHEKDDKTPPKPKEPIITSTEEN